MKDLELGKLSPNTTTATALRSPRTRTRSRRLLGTGALMLLGGLVWLVEAHRLLWYTMNCEYLSHRDARFVTADTNYLCLTDVQLADELRKLTIAATAAFDAHNVTYFLESGTLLGAFREKRVIRHDTDVDLGITASGLAYLQTHHVELPRGYVLDVWNSELHPASVRSERLPVRITHTPTGLYADVFTFLDWQGDATPWGRDAVGPLPSVCFMSCKACPVVGHGRHFSVPRDWVFPLVDCEMDGRSFTCPRESAKYLEHMYGPHFMTPS